MYIAIYIQPRPYPTVSPRRQARISERRGSSSYPRWAFPFRFFLHFWTRSSSYPSEMQRVDLSDISFFFVHHPSTSFFAHLPLRSIHFAYHPFCISYILDIICFALSSILHIICFALSSLQVAEFWLLGVPRTPKPFEGRMADQVLSWKAECKMQNTKCKTQDAK